MVSCRLTGTCTTALRGLVKRGEDAALAGCVVHRRAVA